MQQVPVLQSHALTSSLLALLSATTIQRHRLIVTCLCCPAPHLPTHPQLKYEGDPEQLFFHGDAALYQKHLPDKVPSELATLFNDMKAACIDPQDAPAVAVA